MAGKNFAIGITVGAALAAGFGKTTSGVKRELDAVGRATDMLNRKRAAIQKFQVDSKQVQKLSADLSTAQQRLKSVQQQMRARPGDSGLKREAVAASQAVSRLSERLTAQRRQLGESRRAITDMGLSTQRLAQQYDQLGASIDRMSAKQRRIDALNSRRDQLQAQRGELRGQMIGTAAMGVAVGAPLVKSARMAIEFEDSMAKVGAVSNSSADELKQLTAQARQLGRDTVFTASQAAAGQQFLAMAGFKTGQIMAAMPGMLDIAAAGNIDLGSAADIASNILTGFGLKAEKATDVADVLARTFTTSNTDLAQLGDAMKYVAPVANALGVSLEQTSAMVGLLGDAGIQGSMAGTALRAGFLRLAKLPKMAEKELAKMGIRTMDKSGKMKDMPVLLKEIAEKTAKMESGTRAAFVSRVFGVEASAAFLKLLDDAKAGTLDAKIADLQNAGGTGRRIADMMNATTGGALRRMNSAIEDTAIELGNLFLPTIADAAEKISGISKSIGDFAKEHPQLVKGVSVAAASLIGLRLAVLGGRLALNLMFGGLTSIGLRLAKGGISRVPGLSKLPGLRGRGKGAGDVLGGSLAAGGVQRVYVVNMGQRGMSGGGADIGGGGRTGAARTPGRFGRMMGSAGRFLGRAAVPLAIASTAWSAGEVLTDDTTSGRDKKVALSGLAGGALGGAAAGALAGAAIGSVVPVVGNLVGGLIGGALGMMGGEKLGRSIADAFLARGKEKPKEAQKVADAATPAPAATKPAESKVITLDTKMELNLTGFGLPEIERLIQRKLDEFKRDQETRMRALLHDGASQ
ncbi:phage tail tape measure protein [Burkholderia metallica]|uniref:Phage tail tape measure protein n=1 Tax=Burkholderia metallica TaxID=488729 RepID=A0ABT8PJK0_9BURK|nr:MULTISPECIES: phage tail tape measure protein [Burkholderia cepacia complex]MDN7935194.1 phage tail tape measure protein [Burkholderia metallica]